LLAWRDAAGSMNSTSHGNIFRVADIATRLS
jgi:hypothetical protein